MADYLILKSSQQGSVCLNEDGTWVLEKDNPVSYLEKMCLEHGSTLKGRMDAFCILTGARQKPAVLIHEATSIMYFPTESMSKHTCLWIRYNDIFRISSLGSLKSRILFANGWKEDVDVDSRVLKKQMERCENFLAKLQQGLYSPSESLNAKALLKNLSKL